MKINCEVRQASSNVDAKHYDTGRIRQEYLVQNLMVADEINMVYSMFDRIIAGGAVPVKEDLLLSWAVPLCSWHRMLLMLSTVTCSMWTAVFLPISANSRSKTARKKGVQSDPLNFYLQNKV